MTRKRELFPANSHHTPPLRPLSSYAPPLCHLEREVPQVYKASTITVRDLRSAKIFLNTLFKDPSFKVYIPITS